LLVVPTLGRRLEYLEQTLASVRAQQVPVDIVVVTPSAAEGARSLAARFGARVLDDPGSLSAAVNLGLGQADVAHQYGNWIGDDDLLAPDALAATSQVLDRDPGVVLAFGHCTYIDEQGRPLGTSRAGRAAVWLLSWGPDLVPQPGMLFRLADFKAVGGLDESLAFAMDLDLLLRLRRRGRLVAVDQEVSSFRWHQTSLTVSDRSASLAESEQVKRRYLPGAACLVAPVWEAPVRIATRAAVRRVGKRAQVLAGSRLQGTST
jgi:GT2 family glycosyltransferase